MTGGRLGVVLAGGAGRRFGGPKGRAYLAGRSFVDRAVAVLEPVVVHTVVVSSRPVAGTNVEVLSDRVSGCGPLGGLDTGLAVAEERGFGAVVLLGCDLPLVTEGMMHAVAGALRDDMAVAPTVVPGRVETLCSAWSVRTATAVQRALVAGDLAVHVVFDSVGGRVLPLAEIGSPPAHAFLNVNTPEAAADAASLLAVRAPEKASPRPAVPREGERTEGTAP